MALRDDILEELKRTETYTHYDGLWDTVTDRIMEMITKAAKAGEIIGTDTLSLALESWKKRQADPNRPKTTLEIMRDVFPIQQMPDGALPLFTYEDPDDDDDADGPSEPDQG